MYLYFNQMYLYIFTLFFTFSTSPKHSENFSFMSESESCQNEKPTFICL